MNRTLLDRVRAAMLVDAQLPDAYWYDALHYAAHIHNVTPTQALDDMMPEEAWSGNKPDISDLRIFESRAFMHIPESHCSKLSARSLVCTFIGFADQRKVYKLVHRPTCRFLESRDIIFDEGGPSSRIEHITIKHNSAPSCAAQTQTQTPQTLPPPPSQPQLQPLPQLTQPVNPPDLPAPTVTTVRPRCNTHAPVRDDDSHYNVLSYWLRPTC